MGKVTYDISLRSDHLIIKVTGRNPDMVYVPGKSRLQLTKDALFHLRVLDCPVNKDRLQTDLDNMIWKHLPRSKW